MTTDPRDARSGVIMVTAAGISAGYISVGCRVLTRLGFSLWEIVVLPSLLCAVVLLAARPGDVARFFKRSHLWVLATYGFIGAVTKLSQFVGIVLNVPVAVVVVLIYTQPAWTLVLARFIVNEPLTGRRALAVALALVGVVVLVRPSGEALVGYDPVGVGFSLLGGAILATYVVWSKRVTVLQLPPLVNMHAYVLFGLAWMALLFAPLRMLVDDPQLTRLTLPSAGPLWGQLGLFALFGFFVPNYLVLRGVASAGAAVTGMILLLEPVCAALLAALLFGEALTFNVWLGGGLILGSNLMVLLPHLRGSPVDTIRGPVYPLRRRDCRRVPDDISLSE